MAVKVFFSLPSPEKKLIFHAFFAVLSARVRIWTASPQTFLSAGNIPPHTPQNSLPASRILWSVIAVSKRIPSCSNCLVRALAARTLLSHYGYASELKIGVAKDGAAPRGLKAHAWLEKDGKILIGEEEKEAWTALPPVSF